MSDIVAEFEASKLRKWDRVLVPPVGAGEAVWRVVTDNPVLNLQYESDPDRQITVRVCAIGDELEVYLWGPKASTMVRAVQYVGTYPTGKVIA